MPATVPGLSIDSPRVMDSTGALELEDVPKSLLVVGGGYIGLELGYVYAALGSKVTVVEMTDGLLPGVDRDLVNVLAEARRDDLRGHPAQHQGRGVKEAKQRHRGRRFEGERRRGRPRSRPSTACWWRSAGGPTSGARPGKTASRSNERGFIKVDERADRRAAHLRHRRRGRRADAGAQGDVRRARRRRGDRRRRSAFEPLAIPAVVFTDPEIAWCGLTEGDAKKQGREVKVAQFPWGASGRAMTLGRTEGLTKLIVDPETERVLGVGIVGAGAGELIGEGVLAIEMGATATDLR